MIEGNRVDLALPDPRQAFVVGDPVEPRGEPCFLAEARHRLECLDENLLQTVFSVFRVAEHLETEPVDLGFVALDQLAEGVGVPYLGPHNQLAVGRQSMGCHRRLPSRDGASAQPPSAATVVATAGIVMRCVRCLFQNTEPPPDHPGWQRDQKDNKLEVKDQARLRGGLNAQWWVH